MTDLAETARIDVVDGHRFRIEKASRRALHSRRPLFRVECLTCNVVVHEETTGPQHQIGYHLRGI